MQAPKSVLYTVAVEMFSSIAVGVGLGFFVRSHFYTGLWPVFVGFFLGMCAGFRRIIHMLDREGYPLPWKKDIK